MLAMQELYRIHKFIFLVHYNLKQSCYPIFRRCLHIKRSGMLLFNRVATGSILTFLLNEYFTHRGTGLYNNDSPLGS